MSSVLVLDVSYLCHRAWHSTQALAWKDKPTGVIFGFLKGIGYLKDEFQTDDVVFCFEHSHLFRRDIYPAYKKKRHSAEKTQQEIEESIAFHYQIDQLRKVYLPQIGFKNIIRVDGYESDDTMAAFAATADADTDVIMITADQDMYQCLRENVMMYSPQNRKMMTIDKFIGLYGIHPRMWAMVKAIAGCATDEVEGIKGVGNVRALQYVRGELKESSKAYQAIISDENRAIVRRNRKLVQLPYQGCPAFDLQEDTITHESWYDVCSMLGMRSIAQQPPIAVRRLISYERTVNS